MTTRVILIFFKVHLQWFPTLAISKERVNSSNIVKLTNRCSVWHSKRRIALDFTLYTVRCPWKRSVQRLLYGAFKRPSRAQSLLFQLENTLLSLQYLNFKVVNFVGAEVRNYVSKFTIWLCNWLVHNLVPNFPTNFATWRGKVTWKQL